MASLHHIHIKAKDPSGSAAWWADMFGAAELPAYELRGAPFAPVEVGGVTLSISGAFPTDADRTAPPPTAPHYGLEHIGIIVADLDATLARFEEQGLPVHARREIAGFRIAFATDPDGLLLELMEPLG